MIRLSIITITYNAQETLPRTLKSVLTQNYHNIEHIIVDGASTDGTVKMAKEYKRDSYTIHNRHRVIIVSEPDNGLYDAMNKGLAMATGDYIVFMNAGDFYPEASTVSSIIRKAKAKKAAIGKLPAVLYGDTDIVDSNGVFLRRRRLTPPKQLTWRSFGHGMLVCHQAFYARKDIARGIAYDLRYRYSADVDWCIRVMKAAESRQLPLLNVQATIANYTEEGLSTKHHRSSLKERYRIMEAHYGRFVTFAMHCWFAVRAVMRA